jgi:undecaprenyl-diphosphatase
MSYVEAVLLGLVQAITEFLPVSSSGHLVLAENWFAHGAEVDVFFNVLLHVATMAAVIVYFRREITGIVAAVLGRPLEGVAPFASWERKTAWFIVLANVPTALIGLLIEKYLEKPMERPLFVGLMLMVTGALLWAGRRARGERGVDVMTAGDALIVGVVQGVAVLPGISRSGSTIVAATLLGLRPELAAKFSLLISLPAIVGATLLEGRDVASLAGVAWGPYALGMLIAGVVGYGAIHLILVLVDRRQFYRFAYYVLPLGLVAVLLSLR